MITNQCSHGMIEMQVVHEPVQHFAYPFDVSLTLANFSIEHISSSTILTIIKEIIRVHNTLKLKIYSIYHMVIINLYMKVIKNYE